MCLFCRIVNKEQQADVVYEDEKAVVFKDINPKAPVHLLVVPRKHIETINHLEDQDKELIAHVIFLARDMAKKYEIAETGYQLKFNVGRGGGQIVDHLHLHLTSGKKYGE